MKKITLLILTCFLAVQLYSQTATAPSGSGSSTDPYQIVSIIIK